MALTHEERAELLAEPHVAALSVDSGEKGRAPLSVPVWYRYEPDGEFWIITGRDSRKDRLIAEAGRFTLLIDRVEPTIRYASAEGPVTGREPATKERLHGLAARYLPADKLDAWVEEAWRDHGEQVVIRMRPERWLSADLGRV